MVAKSTKDRLKKKKNEVELLEEKIQAAKDEMQQLENESRLTLFEQLIENLKTDDLDEIEQFIKTLKPLSESQAKQEDVVEKNINQAVYQDNLGEMMYGN